MKTTVEVPDALYRQIKAQAALRGQTIKSFFLDALRTKLDAASSDLNEQEGWRSVFGRADKRDMTELQKIVDAEFSQIDPEGWD